MNYELGIMNGVTCRVFGKENAVVDKSKRFALRIIKLYQYLTETKKEYVMSKQILRSGTSIGSNIREAIRAQSKPDFYTKLYISLKEAEESLYWLELLYESGYIEKPHFDSIYADAEEIVKILVAITKNQGKTIS
jgi:four helix bundle protein